MVKIDGIDGIVNDRFRLHFDIFADVLYVRLLSAEKTEAISALTDQGDLLLRSETTDEIVGMTVLSWWKRFGQGDLPDSISELQRHIEPIAAMGCPTR